MPNTVKMKEKRARGARGLPRRPVRIHGARDGEDPQQINTPNGFGSRPEQREIARGVAQQAANHHETDDCLEALMEGIEKAVGASGKRSTASLFTHTTRRDRE